MLSSIVTVYHSCVDFVIYGLQVNTYWGLSNSPYVIQRPLTVRHGATLSIAPGVHVVFDGSNSGLAISGKMVFCTGIDFHALLTSGVQ